MVCQKCRQMMPLHLKSGWSRKVRIMNLMDITHGEILPSFSTEDSGHLYVGKAPDGNYFSLSGSSKTRSSKIIRCFLALHAASLPVRLHEGNKMQARLEETDMIGIVPEGRTMRYIYSIMEYNLLDAVHLYDGDKPEQVAEKAIWQPEIECKLL